MSFAAAPPPGKFRLLIEEFGSVSVNYAYEGRLIYAETFVIDDALAAE